MVSGHLDKPGLNSRLNGQVRSLLHRPWELWMWKSCMKWARMLVNYSVRLLKHGQLLPKFLHRGPLTSSLRVIYEVSFVHIKFAGIARHCGFASLTHSKSQSRIVVTSAAAHGRIVKTVKKVTTYMVGTVKRQNTSSSECSWRKIAETRQSLFRKSAWSGYAHKMCAVDSNTKRLCSNEMSDRATHFTVFMIMNCPVEQQILAA